VHVVSVGEECCPELFRVHWGDFTKLEDAAGAAEGLVDTFPGAYAVRVANGRFDRLLKLGAAMARRLDVHRPGDPSVSVRVLRLVDLSLYPYVEMHPDYGEQNFASVVEVRGESWVENHRVHLAEECDGTWLVSEHPVAREWFDLRGGIRLSSLFGTDE
jgi:hypothetical protein